MKEKIFGYSKDRPLFVNILFCIISFCGLLIIPVIFYMLLSGFITNKYVCNFVADILLIILLYLMYFKDLNHEFKIYVKNFKENIKKSFKYYLIGFLCMIFFNIMIMFVLMIIFSTNLIETYSLMNTLLIKMIREKN